MTAHLLLVALGPVQEFIAQARRTRDLWYGSHLLSELARAVARALAAGGANLIFPARAAGDAAPNDVGNKLLAEVPAGLDPEALARAARAATMAHWRDRLAAPVKENCTGLLADGIDAAWTEQVDTFVEFTAAWAPLGGHAEARRAVEQAVAARKNLRDFGPWRHSRGQVPKSSLDGARETVLACPDKRDKKLTRKYRIGDREQLDAVGLVKRAGGDPDQFVPVVNVALAAWAARARQDAARELDDLLAACCKLDLARVTRDLPCARAFPFDASVLLRDRWASVFAEQDLKGRPDDWGERHVRPLLRAMGAPHPYVACLVADGDRMGQALDRIGTADAHREFSRRLAGFAAEARRIVEQDHRGALVYAGGDDVLAFLPLPEALACADALRTAFGATSDADPRPTLSVGLGIGHVMEGMGDLLQLGRDAEKEAKRDRNALAVIVDKRSGGRRTWRACWDQDPAVRLGEDRALLGGRLSSRKVFEIERTLRRLPKPDAADAGGLAAVLAGEVRRALARVEDGSLTADEVGLALDGGTDFGRLRESVQDWVSRMLIARCFADAEPRARRREAA